VVSRGLVLGGGGIAGIAWEIGMLAGLAEAGVDATGADLVVGTSAGSVVGTLVRTDGVDIATLYANQLVPDKHSAEQPVTFDGQRMAADFAAAMSGTTSARQARARIGALALAAPTVDEQQRHEIIAARLPSHDWPTERLLITAVAVDTGEAAVFDRTSGVGLVDAVAASCAVPGVWPPTTINGRRYMDGGVRSLTNADLAKSCDRVLIVAPMSIPSGGPMRTIEDEVALLAPDREVFVIRADDPAMAAFGTNPLDPATRVPSARAGYQQAATIVDAVKQFWLGA
jgi:NTE family protein